MLNAKKIPLELAGGLYSSQSQQQIENLIDVAEDESFAKRYPCIVLEQIGDAAEVASTWLCDLQSQALADEVALRITAVRHLVALIRRSPIPWIYASAYDCLGSQFELALACQERWWFRSQANVGIPSIAVGSFLPSGVLERPKKRAMWLAGLLGEQNIFTAPEATKQKLLDFTCDAMDWRQECDRITVHFLNLRTATDETSPLSRRKILSLSALSAERSGALARFASGDALRHKHSSPWDSCLQIVKDRSKLKDNRDLGRLITYHCSQFFLSNRYISYLHHLNANSITLDQSHTLKTIRQDRSHVAPNSSAKLIIDLDYLAPPTAILIALFGSGVRIDFTATTAKALANSLDIVYSRLERACGQKQARTAWEQNVYWYIGPQTEPGVPVIRYSVDDRCSVTDENQAIELIRLAGNRSTAPAGLYEWFEGEASSFLRIVESSGGKVIATKGTLGLPLTLLIRTLALQHLITITKIGDGRLEETLTKCAQAGWGYVSSEEHWDRFLKGRIERYPYESIPALVREMVSQAFWELGSWRHARALSRESDGQRVVSKTALSQALAILAGRLAHWFANEGCVSTLEDADQLVCHALGFPAHKGTPVSYSARFQPGRIESMVQEWWPYLQGHGEKPREKRSS